MMINLKSLNLALLLFLSPMARADHLQFMLGAQIESIENEGATINRSSYSSFYAEYMKHLKKKYYMSIGMSSALSSAGFRLLTFGVDASFRYFVVGQGHPYSLESTDVSFVSNDKIAYFVGLGFTQRFIETATQGSLSRGGLKIENGVKVRWKEPYFYSFHLQYIMAGAGESGRGYNSIDFYGGIGFNF